MRARLLEDKERMHVLFPRKKETCGHRASRYLLCREGGWTGVCGAITEQDSANSGRGENPKNNVELGFTGQKTNKGITGEDGGF